ncbi:molybdopterin synthase catalytic subunit [Sinorhizobium medicae]|uniref:Molybdopterin synthase catalytic subunit n=2 Tax=Sinorhizobium medicae TaxID=110321 RepID=A6U7K5_SINMW|nr:molybdenum cofactor biosynthesis protein MoaE [Sinorhizobium medicae]ABR59635.1 molybdopterin biosynthesis MoaE protein [Sinorhizobium medicae WSM419]MBO1963081.1 molybdenum cofactor biosynthesis protein MoaE [Sinorhizobium medicae]MDX0404261.1 molybdopterin synthase catalytic subunit [Sinorhizobium medicae]MDX0410198.1 molybdopterin synthase catalytic subunit [Sinorhizobium medicae]MDX0416615.1 molybdopterin synthase catalytic subunit [Sinorhizobium medicae]
MAPAPVNIRVQRDDFDIAVEIAALCRDRTDIGAVVTFSGLCRDEAGALSALELEHYPGMAEAEIERICQDAVERFGLQAATAIHRFGGMEPGANIVLVIAAAPHRQAAFDGANFIMDFLKTSAPFWKKEHRTDGSAGDWISAKDADDDARDRWARG